MTDMVFQNAEWIWHNNKFSENEYAEFLDQFQWNGENTFFRISVSGDYTLFINGKYVSSNQYGDFPHYKVYDEIDVTKFLHLGRNSIGILVWYFGDHGMRYFTPEAGLIYEVITTDKKIISFSSKNTLSRKSKTYISGEIRKISPQLGYTFHYDSNAEDDWLSNICSFTKSCVISRKALFYKRPISKSEIGNLIKGKISRTENSYIIDLNKEILGFPVLSFSSATRQNINVSYGEYLKNGHVKRIIGNRDFSFDYTTKVGKNNYTNYMLRLACRYIEITSDHPIDIEYIGILPQKYPVEEKEIFLSEEIDKNIYDICINTLKLCMMEHYVDCPWREQCLYAFDSRNQMLCGYSAFRGGNFEYARANLLLMSKDNRFDGILSICFPSGNDLTIPSFSLYYILAVKEYIDHSGDISLGKQVFQKMESILSVFTKNMKNDLMLKFEGVNHWNFYDWSKYCESEIGRIESGSDLLLNSIAVIALNAFSDICQKLGKPNLFEGIAERIVIKARDKYYNENTGLFFISDKNEEPSELVNSLAIISEIAEGEVAERICDMLSQNRMISCSLSMKTFKYDALIKINREKYEKYIIDEIRSTYSVMLESGSTTVWETANGGEAFDGAGSLCHGWSAIPIHYYNLLKNKNRERNYGYTKR